jgi:hypothetical protein
MGSFSISIPPEGRRFRSLPLRREGVFTSVTLAGILPILASSLLIFSLLIV